MADAISQAAKANVFISYSRDDLWFADQLQAALKLTGVEPSIDRESISGAEAWERRLGALIRAADTIVFVLSPSSATSKACKWEVEQATAFGKRIIPVACRPLEGAAPPPELAELNYIFFYDEPASPGSGFGKGMTLLKEALSVDLDWLREHTRLLQRAAEWEAGGRPSNRLLSGRDIDLANDWGARRPAGAPAPTELHLDFIRASQDWQTQQASEESRRLQERERLVSEAESALTEKEAAQAREAEASRRVVRRTLAGLTAALLLAVVAGGFGWYALKKRGEAESEALRAEQSSKVATAAQQQAVKTRDEALLAQSKHLADISRQVTEDERDPATGILLALEALPDPSSPDEITRNRPDWLPARVSLEMARRRLQERAVLDHTPSSPTTVAVSPDGARIVTGTATADKSVRVWDARTMAPIARLEGHSEMVWSVAVSPDSSRIVSGSHDRTARVWDARTFTEIGKLSGHTDKLNSVAITPDGARFITGSSDKTARVWDARTFAELSRLEGHNGPVSAVAVSPDGSRILTGSTDTFVRIWERQAGPMSNPVSNGESWREVASFKHPSETGVSAVAVTPDGSRIITADYGTIVRVWDAQTLKEIGQLNGHSQWVLSVGVTRDGSRIVTGSQDATVRVWDAVTYRELQRFTSHTGPVSSVAVSPDGTWFVSGAAEQAARVWDERAAGAPTVLTGHTDWVHSVAVSPDGTRVATVSHDGTVRIWNALTAAHVGQLTGHTASVSSVKFANGGTRLVTASRDKTARIWDASSLKELGRLVGHTDNVVGIDISADGRRIVTASKDKTARIWDAETFAELGRLVGHEGGLTDAAFFASGDRVVTGSEDESVRVWNSSTFSEIGKVSGAGSKVDRVAVSPDEQRLLVLSHNLGVSVVNPTTMTEIGKLRGHTGYLWSAAFTPDNSRIVTSSGSVPYVSKYTPPDDTIRVWDASTLTEIARLKGHAGAVYDVAVAADNSHIVSGSGDGTARIWKLLPRGQALIEDAKSAVPRCLTSDQRLRFHLGPTSPHWCEAMRKWAD